MKTQRALANITTHAKKLSLALCVMGILVSLYLTYAKLTATSLLCLDTGCDIVQNSPYSQIMGVPVAIFGLFFYFALFVLIYKNLKKLERIFVITGLIFSLYLSYLELFVIFAICTWCVISFVIVALLTILAFLPKNGTTVPNSNLP